MPESSLQCSKNVRKNTHAPKHMPSFGQNTHMQQQQHDNTHATQTTCCTYGEDQWL